LRIRLSDSCHARVAPDAAALPAGSYPPPFNSIQRWEGKTNVTFAVERVGDIMNPCSIDRLRPQAGVRRVAGLILGFDKMLLHQLPVTGGQLLRLKLDRQLGDLAVEAERHVVVLVVHRRAEIHSHIERFVN
jgi:hypothetical protein